MTPPTASGRPAPATYDDFAALEGHVFAVAVEPDGVAELTLSRCSPPRREHGHVSYTLSFQGSSEQPLAQGTFEFTSEGTAPTAMFIVPTAADGDRIEYEAVFNQEEG